MFQGIPRKQPFSHFQTRSHLLFTLNLTSSLQTPTSVINLQRKTDSSHLNLIVLLTTILEEVGQSAKGIDTMRREFKF